MMEDGNSAAESRHAHEEAEGEKLREMYYQKALDDLVWRMMDGQEYPRQVSHMQVNLLDLLEMVDDLPRIVHQAVTVKADVTEAVTPLIADVLRDSGWHERRIAEMISEDKE